MAAVKRTLPAPPELQSHWASVLEEAGRRPEILALSDRYPEERSLVVPFSEIDRADTSLADVLLERPEEVLDAGQRAMRELLPVAGAESEGLRLRITGLPPTAHRLIREIRESDLNRLIALDGIVRRVTEVRPQIRDAVFQCVACRTEFHEPQDEASMVFREPLECPESQGGCGKPQGRTRFRLLPEKSSYVDAQRIEIQENPEILKHGAHPQGLAVMLTEDLAGHVLPGNRVVLNGVLKSFQRASASRGGVVRNTTFDLLVLGNSVEWKQEEYDEIVITPEEERLFLGFQGDPTVVDKIVMSLAPTIKGMEEEKEAIALQLFGGVEKKHPDGIRVRGDIHALIVGDPGCLIGDERVVLGDGTISRLDRLGHAHLQPIATRVRLGTGFGQTAMATRFHRYARQPIMEVITESGKSIKGTYNHPLLRWNSAARREEWCRLDRLKVGDRLRVAPSIRCWKSAPVPTGWRAPRYFHKSWHVKVPSVVDEDLAAILGYVLGDGTVSPRRVTLYPGWDEHEVIQQISGLFDKVFGVTPQLGKVRRHCRPLQVNRTPIARWLYGLRRHRVPDLIFASPNGVVSSFLRWLFEAEGCAFANGRGRTALQLRSSNIELLRDVQALLLRWGIHSRILWGRPPRPQFERGEWIRGGESGSLVIRRGPSITRFAESIGFVSSRKRSDLAKADRAVRQRSRAWRAHTTERVTSICPAGIATVYDVEVPGARRFIANGIISHNTAKSQLLRYVAEVAPRGIYTSGKGATAAGLTAAAVKDDFAGGRWVLEAGMLVLADGGMAVIDELDKMSPDDRSAMHEALEQQSYHPSFEIMMFNGEKKPIGEFVEGLLHRHPGRAVPGRNCEILPLRNEGYSLLSTDFRGLHEVPVDRVSRHAAPSEFIRVTYGNGRNLTVTPEHPLFVWRDGQWATVSAEKVLPGDLTPGVSGYPRALNAAVLRPPEHPTGKKAIVFPVALTEDLSRLLGCIASEGHLPKVGASRTSEIGISTTDPEVVEDVRDLFRSVFGVEPYVQVQPVSSRRKATLPLYTVRAVSVDLLRYLGSNFPELARNAPDVRVPGPMFHATEPCRIQFLLGAYRGDGFYDSERFGLSTSSGGLARDYADLLLSMGIYSYIGRASYRIAEGRTGTAYKVVISGASSQRRFYEFVGRHDPRAARILRFVERSEGQPMDGDRLPAEVVSSLKGILGLLRLDDGYFHQSRESGGGCHRTTVDRYLRKVEDHLASLPPPTAAGRTAREVRKTYHLTFAELALRLGRSGSWVRLHDRGTASPQARELHRAAIELAEERLAKLREAARAVRGWVDTPIRFIPIRAVEVVPNEGEKWVYDVTVEPTHTFVGEGLVLHNTVSIAKAGITSTLNARCPVLAAANPKWGRFTNDRTISEQIDLPPTLLSRFDVIFSIKDQPNQERDRRLAAGILASHRDGESRVYPANERTSSSGAPFPPELLKKYIAYAKRTVRPILSDAALSALSEYYVKVRSQGEEPNSPVPITARQLEALVRLSEAAAKARLSNEVGVEDAQRAIQIMQNFLKRVAMTEGGKLDVDLVQSGVSHSQRERLDIVMRVMRELQDRPEATFSVEEYLEAADRAGVPPNRAEALLQTLRNQGEIIESRPNRLQLVRF